MNIIFTNQYYLSLLFFIPLVILIHFLSIKVARKQAFSFANFDALARIKGVDIYSKNINILVLTCVIIFLIALGLSGTVVEINKNISNFSFVVAVDSSKSMSATDISPDRLDAAKQTAINFVDKLPLGTKVGVISFSGSAIIEQKVMEDKNSIKDSISNIELTTVGGTDIYEAIITAVNLLYNEKNKAIILLSDGQINVGSIDNAIEYAKENKVIINTVSIGTTLGGNTSYGFSKVDEDSLKALSFNTGGVYNNANNQEQLSSAFDQAIETKYGLSEVNISTYLILSALVLLVLEFVLINMKNRTFP